MIRDYVRVHKTDFIFDQCKDLNFDGLELKLTNFCNNNKTVPVRISVYCYTNSGDHELYGRVVTSVKEIEMGKEKLELINKRNKNMGYLYVDNF